MFKLLSKIRSYNFLSNDKYVVYQFDITIKVASLIYNNC